MKNYKFILICVASLFSLMANSQRFAVIGDAGHWNIRAQEVRDSIAVSGITDLVLPGDNLYNTSLEYDDVWSHWREHQLEFSVTALGNHYKSIPEEIRYFNMPSTFYVKDYDDVRFIVLDSETQDVLDQQKSFLIDALEKSTKMFNVLVYHHPMATVSYRHGWKEREEFHMAMRPVIKKYNQKINLIINGHDHIASLFTYDGMAVLVSGAVFESRPAPAFEYQQEGGGYVQTKWVNTVGHYWVELDFDAKKNFIKLGFVRTDKSEVSCLIYIKGQEIYRHQSCLKSPMFFDNSML